MTAAQVAVTPDGERYLAMGSRRRVAMPFHLRWLVPFLCRDEPVRWIVSTVASTLLAAAGVFLLACQHGLTASQSAAAATLWAGLPSVRFAWRFPILVDMPTIATAVWAAVLFDVHPAAGIAASVVAGAVNERGPLFAALFAWHPLLLAGFAAPSVRFLQAKGEDPGDELNRWIVTHPVQSSRMFHANKWRDPKVMVLPWGGALAALAALDPQVVAALAVSYAQLVVATDTLRLYQQAAPIVCIAAMAVVPVWVLPALVVVTWFNPVLAGDGV